MTDLPTSRVVQFGNPVDPTADQRRSSNYGIKIFSALLFLPFIVSEVATFAMNLGLFAALLNGPFKLFGVLFALAVTLALGGMLTVSAAAHRDGEPAIALIAALFFAAFLILSLIAAHGFGYVLGFDYPATEPRGRVIFDDEPRQIEIIERAKSQFLRDTFPKVACEGCWRPTGAEILHATNECRIKKFDFEDGACELWDRFSREKQARLDCDAGRRTDNCGLTLHSASSPSTASPFTPEDIAKGKALAAHSAPYLFVFMAAGLGAIFFWFANKLMTVRNEAPPAAAPIDLLLPPSEPESLPMVDHFEEWHSRFVIPDPNEKNLLSRDILAHYKAWCSDAGYVPLSDAKFYERFRQLHRNDFAHNNDSAYDGLRLKPLM